MSRRDLYFAVEGGSTLELAQKHVAQRVAVENSNRAMAQELGADRYIPALMDGVLCGVIFNGKPHPDFKKPNNRGFSFPKKGSEWAERLAATTGYDKRGYALAETLGVPTCIGYEKNDCRGNAVISASFTSGVGFLYLSKTGPFALYIPDIAERVALYEEQGYTVDENCKNFVPKFDGARQILKEEWELMVAHHKLAEAEQAVAA